MQRYMVYFVWKLLYMFRVVPPPIIRSATALSVLWVAYTTHNTLKAVALLMMGDGTTRNM
jgi:hypothetical protein